MSFDPSAHMLKLPQRKKDDRGNWVTTQEDYLAVKWRLVWFREKYPHGSITTEAILLEWEKGIAIYKATVEDGEGGRATGTGTETRKSFEDFVEKAETRSIGRALAALGIGTQFVGEELSEGDHVADAPVAPSTNGHIGTTGVVTEAQEPPPIAHPTAEDIDRLGAIATAAGEDKEVFGDRLRRLLKLGADVKLTKKFLRETMTVEQFGTIMAYYENLLRQVLRPNVTTTEESPNGPVTTPTTSPEPTPTPTAETTAAVPPIGSSSAPATIEVPPGTTTDEAKAALRREARTWGGISDKEIDYILDHHPLATARNMLWKARLRTEEPALAS